MEVVGSNKMTQKREAILRCCEWITEHFADQEQSDEEEYFTDFSLDDESSSEGSSLSSEGETDDYLDEKSFLESSDEDTSVGSLEESSDKELSSSCSSTEF